MFINVHFHVSFGSFCQWRRARKAINLVAFTLLLFFTLQATDAMERVQAGVVTRVVDGDTLWLRTAGNELAVKVRLQGIDAPEICQSGGAQARQALQRRVLGKSVTVTSSARDDYGRSVGIVRIDGQDLGRWLVSQGHAWVYSYRQKKSPYANELTQAQRERRGIFNSSQAEEPRLFRKRYGSCYRPR